MKKIIILLLFIFAFISIKAQSPFKTQPGTDIKLITEIVVNAAKDAPYVKINDSLFQGSFWQAFVRANILDSLAAGKDTIGRSASDTVIYDVWAFRLNGETDTLRCMDKAGKMPYMLQITGPYAMQSEDMYYYGEVVDAVGFTNKVPPKAYMVSNIHWVSPSTNLTDFTPFHIMQAAIRHNINQNGYAYKGNKIQVDYLYGQSYNVILNCDAQAKKFKYKIWQVRIGRGL